MDVTEKTRTRARDAFLLSLDDAVRPLSDPSAVVSSVASLLGDFLEVDRVAYADFDRQTETFTVIGEFNRNPEAAPGRSCKLSDVGPEIARLFELGQPLVLDDLDKQSPGLDEVGFYKRSHARATISVPLLKDGQLVGAMSVHQNSPRQWLERELELVKLVANRCWESIERMRVERNLRQSEARFRGMSAALASEKIVLEMIATGSPLPDVLTSIARNAEAQSVDNMMCR